MVSPPLPDGTDPIIRTFAMLTDRLSDVELHLDKLDALHDHARHSEMCKFGQLNHKLLGCTFPITRVADDDTYLAERCPNGLLLRFWLKCATEHMPGLCDGNIDDQRHLTPEELSKLSISAEHITPECDIMHIRMHDKSRRWAKGQAWESELLFPLHEWYIERMAKHPYFGSHVQEYGNVPWFTL